MKLPYNTVPIEINHNQDGCLISSIGLFNLEYSVECGQAFRWYWTGGYYTGVVGGKVIRIAQTDKGLLLKKPYDDEVIDMVIDYFNLKQNSEEIERQLSEKDEQLSTAVARHPGMKILKQDPWECIVSYIISARNNIPSIKRTILQLCERFGTPIDSSGLYTFPTPESLATADIDELLKCKAAFRTRYIKETARLVYESVVDLNRLSGMELGEAKEILLTLPGVGPKVADCISLFSLGHYDAFPIDVWIARAMRHLYFGGSDIPFKTVAEYARNEFGALAGYANQHLFFYARNIKIGRVSQ